ncbi:hypothetical protein FOE78_21070 [Microlunatus elymi]|uniref:Esterase-like activity of phytase family protein n=1 Tax=Microlunatus elymi TaxID=2596828 RepID=A0A516Q3Q6_9ACTN|nr:hypothetical protein [Microlunatus elymi]QDP98059.1 hypothetical protein FOE78_21070 [Microlunatus elymi]
MSARPARPLPALIGLLLVGLLLAGWAAAPAYADDQPVFTISDARISESSGLATDTNQGLYWTVNDSGDEARAFALNESGQVRGTLGFRAQVTDVEAVAYHDGSLYIGDIGDNDGKRDFVTVYELSNPAPDNGTVLYHAYDFAYPDGAHDAEALLIKDTGRIYIVTKGADGGIYRAPKDPSRQQVNQLTRVADAPPYVTDGTFLADGRMALRSYVDVKIVDPGQDYKVVAQAATPFQPQGESITTSLDGKSLLVGSEGKDSAVYSMPIPQSVGQAPSAGASPPAESATPTPTPSATARRSEAPQDTDVENTSGPGRRGTWGAIGLAGLVAVVAAAGVYFARARR